MKETHKINYVANLLRLKGSSRKLCLLNVNVNEKGRNKKWKMILMNFLIAVQQNKKENCEPHF